MTNVVLVAPKQSVNINLAANASTLGNTQLVAGQPFTKIRVMQVAVVTTAANSVKFQSNVTDVSATFPLGANGGIVLPYNQPVS